MKIIKFKKDKNNIYKIYFDDDVVISLYDDVIVKYNLLVNKEMDINKFNDITYTCIYMIANIANLINPFLPETSNKIKEMLNLDEFKWMQENISGNIKINDLKLLFNRIDE